MGCAAYTLSTYFAECYLPQRLVGRSPRTLEAYGTALSRWQRFSPASPVEAIDAKLIARFQSHLLETAGAPSANCYCRHLLAILRFYAEESDTRPPKWRKLREPRRVPLALTVEEFSKVLATAEGWASPTCAVSGRDWWRSILLVAWETGLRFRALLELKTIDVLWDSAGLICQAETQKDREAQWFPLPPHTLDAIRGVYSPSRVLLWPRDRSVETIGRWFRKILDASDIYAPQGCGMRFHRLRKSKASYTKAAGGDAQLALGHSAPSVTARYLDPRIVGTATPTFMPRPV